MDMLWQPTYHKGIEALLHAHIIAFFQVAEVDVIFFILVIMVGKLIEAGRHDCGDEARNSRQLNIASERLKSTLAAVVFTSRNSSIQLWVAECGCSCGRQEFQARVKMIST